MDNKCIRTSTNVSAQSSRAVQLTKSSLPDAMSPRRHSKQASPINQPYAEEAALLTLDEANRQNAGFLAPATSTSVSLGIRHGRFEALVDKLKRARPLKRVTARPVPRAPRGEARRATGPRRSREAGGRWQRAGPARLVESVADLERQEPTSSLDRHVRNAQGGADHEGRGPGGGRKGRRSCRNDTTNRDRECGPAGPGSYPQRVASGSRCCRGATAVMAGAARSGACTSVRPRTHAFSTHYT
eukprot:scaffold4958_cov406-Prasinococcus_capsulatus_cf.AAC.14